MASVLTRLASLFPSFRRTYAPAIETPEERAARILAQERANIDRARARPRPSFEEKVPTNYSGGAASKIWFLPYQDSTTKDSPEIRAAMRLMRRDGYVKAAWEPQILTVASEDWQIQPSESGNPESEEQADTTKRMIEDYLAGGIISIVRAICAPLGSEGHSLAEPVWNLARKGRLAKKIVCTKLAARDTGDLDGDVRLYGDEFGNVKWVQARRKSVQSDYPIEDFVFTRYMTVFDEPLGEAAFRPAYSKYWMRDTVSKLRVIHHEKRMAGMLKGTYVNDDDKAVVEAALRNAKSSTWVCVPEGVQIDAINLSTASEPDYRSFDEGLRDEIVTAIAFATLQIIQGNVPDARGDTKVQKAMSDLGPWLLMSLVTDAVNTQLIPKFIDYNYPYPAGGAYPKLTFGAASNSELLELLQVAQGAQQLGFQLSKKHYAKALSLQLADPNDPDDTITQPGMGGGFPPGDPMGGGDPAMLPPMDPAGGGFGGQAFSEQSGMHWDKFAWSDWKQKGDRMVSPSGKRSLKLETFQRLSARGNHGQQTSVSNRPTLEPGPVAPTPAPVERPGGPSPGPSVPRRGKLRRLAAATGRGLAKGAKATYKAKLAAARLAGKGALVSGAGAVSGVARLGQAVSYVKEKLGAVLQRVPILESWLGIGTAIRNSAKRKKNQARNTAIMALTKGQRGQGVRRAATGILGLLDIQFESNRRRFGVVRALVIESAILAAKIAIVAPLITSGIAAAGLIPAGAGALAGAVAAGSQTAGALAGGFVAKELLKSTLGSVIRSAVEYPFRKGKGRRGAGNRQRQLESQMESAKKVQAQTRKGLKLRNAARIAKGNKPRSRGQELAGGMIAAPSAVVLGARSAMNQTGARDFVPTGRATTSRRTIYNESGPSSVDPMDLVAAFRSQLEAAIGEPVDVPDTEIADLLADMLEYADDVTAEAADKYAAFSELDWEAFAWQAGRTRAGKIKAIGTAEDTGKTLYGRDAEAALTRKAGVGPRVKTNRTLTYETVGPRGGVKRTRERNVTPERARQVALQQAIDDAAGPQPQGRARLVKISKAARKKKIAAETARLTGVAQQATAGDPKAVAELSSAGNKAVQSAVTALAQLGPMPVEARPVIRAAWQGASKGMPKGQRKEMQGLLDATFGSLGDAKTASSGVGQLVGWLGRQTGRGAKLAVGALVRFGTGLLRLASRPFRAIGRSVAAIPRTARRLGNEVVQDLSRSAVNPLGVKQVAGAGGAVMGAAGALLRGAGKLVLGAGKLAGRATLGVGKLGLRAAGAVGAEVWRAVKPFVYWAGGMAAGAALLAAPVAAVATGVISPVAGLIAAPAVVAGTMFLGRRFLSKAVADAGLEATGNDAIVPRESKPVPSWAYDPSRPSVPRPPVLLEPELPLAEELPSQTTSSDPESQLRAARRRIESAIKPRADGTYDTSAADEQMRQASRQIDEMVATSGSSAMRLAQAATGNDPEDPADAARLLKAWVAQTLNALENDGPDPLDRSGRGSQRWTLSERRRRIWESFAWSDWKQQGDRMVSPSGKRKLTLETFQKLSNRAKTGQESSAPKPKAIDPPAQPEPGRTYEVDPKQIAVDPGRFQFKLNTDSVKGVGTELAGVDKYDPELGGLLAVWRDPADGKTYVVNGHHRLDLANRAGAGAVSVRYLNAPTAELARAKGALINIAEGRGTAVDAAKFMRDTGRSAADLAAAGVSLKGEIARDAAELVKLAPDLFRQVAYGTLDADRAVAVARNLTDHLDQQRLLSTLAKQEDKTGRTVSSKVVDAMAQEMRDAPKLTRTQETLFGPMEQDESVYFHRAELKSYIRAELAKEAKDFRLGSSVRRANALQAVGGNTLAVNENRKVADKADAALEDFDRGARLKGPLSDLLNDYAVEYAEATNAGRSQLRSKVLAAVRAVLSGGDPGRPQPVERRSPGLFD